MSKFSGLFLKSQINFDKYKTDDNSTSNFFQVFILHYVGLSPIPGLGRAQRPGLSYAQAQNFRSRPRHAKVENLKYKYFFIIIGNNFLKL